MYFIKLKQLEIIVQADKLVECLITMLKRRYIYKDNFRKAIIIKRKLKDSSIDADVQGVTILSRTSNLIGFNSFEDRTQ